MFLLVVYLLKYMIVMANFLACYIVLILMLMRHLLNLLDMEQKIQRLFGLLTSIPKWARVVVIFLIAAITAVLMVTSCASAQRISITIKDTPSGVSISTSQSADSSGTNINLNPTINFPQ